MRFTTYEVVETVPLIVIKKDNSREPFDRQKLLNAMLRACAKRPVSYDALERAVSSIEQSLMSSYDREVSSVRIGELTMQELKKIDEVAYVRFASVYQQFADVESFFTELKKLMGDRKEKTKVSALKPDFFVNSRESLAFVVLTSTVRLSTNTLKEYDGRARPGSLPEPAPGAVPRRLPRVHSVPDGHRRRAGRLPAP